MADKKKGRRGEILNAARGEFIAKGLAGARTKVIAEHIGVTKAMIHYYFDTKENLFKEVFRSSAGVLLEDAFMVLDANLPLFKKIEQLIDELLDRFEQQPEVVHFVVSELNQHPGMTESLFQKVCDFDTARFAKQLEEAAADYTIVPVQADQLMANTIALCMFPYSGRNFLRILLSKDDQAYDGPFLSSRRELIKDTIINGLAG